MPGRGSKRTRGDGRQQRGGSQEASKRPRQHISHGQLQGQDASPNPFAPQPEDDFNYSPRRMPQRQFQDGVGVSPSFSARNQQFQNQNQQQMPSPSHSHRSRGHSQNNFQQPSPSHSHTSRSAQMRLQKQHSSASNLDQQNQQQQNLKQQQPQQQPINIQDYVANTKIMLADQQQLLKTLLASIPTTGQVRPMTSIDPITKQESTKQLDLREHALKCYAHSTQINDRLNSILDMVYKVNMKVPTSQRPIKLPEQILLQAERVCHDCHYLQHRIQKHIVDREHTLFQLPIKSIIKTLNLSRDWEDLFEVVNSKKNKTYSEQQIKLPIKRVRESLDKFFNELPGGGWIVVEDDKAADKFSDVGLV